MADLTGKITVALYGYWHAGGGLGGDFGADAVVRKAHGLPILPGRHLLGLLTHSLRFLSQADIVEASGVSAELRDFLCGVGVDEPAADDEKKTRFETQAGALRVQTACLSQKWQDYAQRLKTRERTAFAAPLYRRFGSTKLDKGVAANHTLRHVEVTVPMELQADFSVEAPPGGGPTFSDAEIQAAINTAAGMVQSVGRHRTRGLGRARLSVAWNEG